jgi:hypothetical protein
MESWNYVCYIRDIFYSCEQWKSQKNAFLKPKFLPKFSSLNRHFFPFFAIKLGYFKVIALFSYVTKWENLTAKIGKKEKKVW